MSILTPLGSRPYRLAFLILLLAVPCQSYGFDLTGFCRQSLAALSIRSVESRMLKFQRRLENDPRFKIAFPYESPSELLSDGGFRTAVYEGRLSFNGEYLLVSMDSVYWKERWGFSKSPATGRRMAYYGRSREFVRIKTEEGKLVDNSGNLLDGKYTYVMDGRGNIFAAKVIGQGSKHHSELGNGDPVACAGELHIEKGVILRIDGSSGHYRPPRPLLHQVIARLAEQGVTISRSADPFASK